MSLNTTTKFANYSLKHLAQIAGKTPAYIYDGTTITTRIKHLRSVISTDIKLNYSIKANPYAPIVSLMGKLVDGMDVASHHEMLLAIGANIPPPNVSFSGPGKSDVELLSAITLGIVLHIESSNELERVNKHSQVLGIKPNLAIRLNPPFTMKSSGMTMGGGAQPFGVDLEQADYMLERIAKLGYRCSGFHSYAGSQILNPDNIIQMQSGTLDMMLKLAKKHNLEALDFNIGGGFGIPYTSKDNNLDIIPIIDSLNQTTSRLRQDIEFGHVILELGRYLVGEAGIFLCKVIDKKHSRGTTYLVLDGGLNNHLAATGNLGQTIPRNYPIMTESRDQSDKASDKAKEVTLVGPLCTPLDVIARKILLPDLAVGDFVAISQSGAYGYSASPQQFLSHPAPTELLIY